MPSETANETWYARPVFFVGDGAAASQFYRRLGFHERWRHEEGGRLAALQVERNGIEIILNEDADRHGGGRLFLSLEPGQVRHCVDEFTRAGIEMQPGHWGMPVRLIVDPWGNDLVFFDDELGE